MMKNLHQRLAQGSLLVAATLVFFAQSASAQKFEGSVTWKVVSAQMGDQDKHDMVMNMKGDKFEVDMDAGVQGMLHIYLDRANKKATVVSEQHKAGMIQNLPDDSAVAAAAAKMKDVDLKATGQKNEINGHACELYVLTSPTETVNMWMSKDFTPGALAGIRAALMNNTKGSPAQKKAFRDLAEKGYFPVKIEGKDGGSMELVSIEAKSLPDSVFTVPTDIMIIPAGGMGGAMSGHPGMHGGMPQGGDH
jgi:hypothetical protein